MVMDGFRICILLCVKDVKDLICFERRNESSYLDT